MNTYSPGRIAACGALAVTLVVTACSSSLKDDELNSLGGTLEAWPELDEAGTATTPVYPDVTLTAYHLLRTDDGIATMLFDLANRSNDDLTAGDILGYDDFLPITLYDPEGNVEYQSTRIDHEQETGGCACSSATVPVPAGETSTLHVTYSDIPEEIETVRLNISRFTPIADVPVTRAGSFEVATGAATQVEYDDDLVVAVDSVRPHEEGTVVTARYINRGSTEPVPVTDFPSPGSLSLVDADLGALFWPRTAADEPVATQLSEETTLAKGESAEVEVLMARVPDDTSAVRLRGPGLRGSLPAPVEDDPAETDTLSVPGSLDDPAIRTLHSPTLRYSDPEVPTEEPDLPPIDETGAELPSIDVTETLTSEAQPGWAVGVRGLVRGPGAYSTLLVDITGDDVSGWWPEGLGLDQYADDLGAITVIDPQAEKLYGVYATGTTAFSVGGNCCWRDGDTVHGYAILPPVEPSASTVTVDVPTFGQVEGVPVVDGPERPVDGPVKATMRVRENDRLRLDILTVSRLAGSNGTLVRARAVNESDPDLATAAFADHDSLCDLVINDPTTGDRYFTTDPCTANVWSVDLAQGAELVYEVRFPELPENLDEVVLAFAGYLPSGPIRIEDDQRPWYLTLPDQGEPVDGTTYYAAEGTADGLATTTQTEDTVEVVLSTDVLFDFDSAELTPDAASRVAALVTDIEEQAAAGSVAVTGYTDDVGEEDYNQTLSEQRAEAVRAALAEAMTRSDLTFEVQGRGENDPVAPNQIEGRDNPDGRARNRRVTIVYEPR